jgi:hypothetical protein
MNSANATRAPSLRLKAAASAALVIEGEEIAAKFISRLEGGMEHPDELARMMGLLRAELLHGFCRVVQKTLEAKHG